MTYWWAPDAGSKFNQPYTADHVRQLKDMVKANLTLPHEFEVITDQPELFDDDLDIRAILIDWATHVPKTCYVRLMTFHPQGQEIIGDKVLQIDLDTLIVGNIDHLVSRDEDLVLWRNPARLPWADLDANERRAFAIKNNPELVPALGPVDWRNESIGYRDEHGSKRYVVNQLRTYYNTSILLHRCGTKPEIWRGFLETPASKRPKDDQWYLSDLYGMQSPYFDGERDGVYRLPRSDTPDPLWADGLPANACIVTFPGDKGKWSEPAIREAHPWIAEYRP
jgi:hypothetical protein